MSFINKNIFKNRILILDFYSQYTQLIARRVRELGVYCEIFLHSNVTENVIRMFNPSGIILSGSPWSIRQERMIYDGLKYIFKLNIPILGICYGMHIIVKQFGGILHTSLSEREFGCSRIEIIADSILTQDIYDDINVHNRPVLNVWMSHTDTVVSVPNEFIVVGVTEKHNTIAIIVNEEKCLFGLQFHPEVTHTVQGIYILKRFVLKVCSCQSLWYSSNIIDYLVTDIKNIVNNDRVLLAFSGGIDSLVTALLLRRALGNDKLICCFIDTGLLRDYDLVYIQKLIQEYELNIISVPAADRFFDALVGVRDSEAKRKVIGRVFGEVFEEQKQCLFADIQWLAQGTIYPDVIESGVFSGVNVNKHFVIKSHHNVGGLSSVRSMRLLEPIKNLFKDEVRNLGKELGVSFDILSSHPFPGPGLGIRVLGEVNREYCDLLRRADRIFIEELKISNLYTKISQAFVVFLPVRSVGIMGDVRKYEWVVALRAVETIDFMTARWANLSYDFLCNVSTRIINEVSGVSRVVYDISNKPPSTIEWE